MGVTVPDEVAQLLTDEPVVAHLATCRDGRPHVAPLWFRYVGLTDVPDDQSDEDREVIEIMTTGRKLADLRANPRVALSVQQDEDGHPNWRVVLRGTATVIEDADETRAANRALWSGELRTSHLACSVPDTRLPVPLAQPRYPSQARQPRGRTQLLLPLF